MPNLLPPGLQTFRSSLLLFTLFGHAESTKLNSIRKGFDGKVQIFLPTKISSFTVMIKGSKLWVPSMQLKEYVFHCPLRVCLLQIRKLCTGTETLCAGKEVLLSLFNNWMFEANFTFLAISFKPNKCFAFLNPASIFSPHLFLYFLVSFYRKMNTGAPPVVIWNLSKPLYLFFAINNQAFGRGKFKRKNGHCQERNFKHNFKFTHTFFNSDNYVNFGESDSPPTTQIVKNTEKYLKL